MKNIKGSNVLFRLHTEFTNVTLRFRERVCEECNFSIPTFYRKVRGHDKVIDGRLILALSKAEKDKIKEIGDSIKDELTYAISALILEE